MARPSEFQRGILEGIGQGKQQRTKEVLDWLEREYLKPGVTRGSEKGEAILELVRELSRAVRDGSL